MARRVAGGEALDNMLQLFVHREDGIVAVNGLCVKADFGAAGLLSLRYEIACRPALITIAQAQETAERSDDLWKSTCFECFVKIPGTEEYLEFNFSTAGKWAAYSFTNYRSEMAQLELSSPPRIQCHFDETHFSLDAALQLPAEYSGQPLDAAITAIIAEKSGAKSHWSLKHPPGKPDFHHQACFALKLAPRKQA